MEIIRGNAVTRMFEGTVVLLLPSFETYRKDTDCELLENVVKLMFLPMKIILGRMLR